MADFLKKYWGYVLTVVGAMLFFWQKEKLDEANVENTLADTKKTDAVLATQENAVQSQIVSTQEELIKEKSTPPPTGDALAKELDKI